MAEKLDPQQIADFKELMISNMIEIQAIVQLLMEKGIIEQYEYIEKLKKVQMEYEKPGA